MADAAVKGSKVMGDLGKQQINIGEFANKAAMAMRNLAGSLKLFVAGGVALGGLVLIWKAIATIAEKAERAEKALRAMLDAQTALDEQARESAEQVSAARAEMPRQRPATFAEEEAARKTAAAAPADIAGKLEEIMKTLGGAKGFGPGAGQFTGSDLEHLVLQR